MIVACLALSIFVLARSWVIGDLARTFPDCDPCGFTGYAGRMVIVSATLVGIAGVPAAIAGWLVESVWFRLAQR